MAALICQLSQTVCVEVDAAPQQDLNQVLEEIRCHYETIIDKHRKKQECWFKEKVRFIPLVKQYIATRREIYSF